MTVALWIFAPIGVLASVVVLIWLPLAVRDIAREEREERGAPERRPLFVERDEPTPFTPRSMVDLIGTETAGPREPLPDPEP